MILYLTMTPRGSGEIEAKMVYNYKRRVSSETKVGKIGIGGKNPIRVQSMNNTSTMNTSESIAQAKRIADAGGELVRLTTQGVREASNMAEIRSGLHALGCQVPLVADVHFNPAAAFKAAETCEKVRINPGNFVDAARTFKKIDFSDEEYAEELGKIRDKLLPFLDICRSNSVAVRLGVNHGSLSDRIMSRFGDTPRGMVESVMEFLRIAREVEFNDIVISIKASNPVVMVQTVKLLVDTMQKEGMAFPIHLGVTEAGDGEDGRVKSAVGIGALMAEGIGDTIRVSLTEDPEREIPVAIMLRDYISARKDHLQIPEPEITQKGVSRLKAEKIPGLPSPVVIGVDIPQSPLEWHMADASVSPSLFNDKLPVVLTSHHINLPGEIASWIDRFYNLGASNPVIVKLNYSDTDKDTVRLKAAADFGTLLLNGYASGIALDAPALNPEERNALLLGILQATRLRISKTEYIACPGCGRTLFDLQKTLAKVREATNRYKGLKIGVMGCIVNGPGEMADADYGYVGAGAGKVSLYKGKQLIEKNIPESEAIPRLLDLINSDPELSSVNPERN